MERCSVKPLFVKGGKSSRKFPWRNCSKVNSKLIPISTYFKDFAKIEVAKIFYCILKT